MNSKDRIIRWSTILKAMRNGYVSFHLQNKQRRSILRILLFIFIRKFILAIALRKSIVVDDYNAAEKSWPHPCSYVFVADNSK